ncbi:OFA family MFS transporter [Hujiaoplasma nucleasis]|uniref:OFA family MFS transporter n=1 Tax=Hujiaoplasma nucleasis TaxID=2725268 RepID=A0A7L6N140_9MOLU|nr:MFS transporter [Hujiaoplasma nucleasis]QLY39970.1 OFA family MFS transporter [Hujiaoplasma nucleasis]
MKKTTLITMSLITMIMLGSVYTWSVFRIPVESFYEINTFMSGLPYMVSLWFYALSMVISGRFLNLINMKKFAFIGVLLIVFGWVMAGLTTTIFGLVIMYGVFIGLGVGILYGIPIMIIQSLFNKNSGFYTGLVLAGFGLSPLVTAPIIKTLLNNVTLHQTFMLIGLLSFIILMITSTKLTSLDKSLEKDVSVGSKIKIDKVFIILYFLFLFGTTIGLMMIGLSYQVGVQYYDFSPSKVTLAMTMFALANGMSRLLFGYLSDRFNLKNIIRLAVFILFLSGIIAYINKGRFFGLYLLSFSGFWFILGAWLAIAPNAIKTIYGLNNYSKRYGVLFTAYGLGAIIGVSVSGLILDALKATQALYLIIMGISLMCLFVLGVKKFTLGL